MSIFSRIARLFSRRPSEASEGIPDDESFVYVKLPEDILPLDRGAKYEDPLDALLREQGIGEVTGAGSQLGDRRPDGTRGIEFCGIDVEVTDLDRALALLRDALPDLGAPEGTELHYSAGAKLLDAYAAGSWTLARPRKMRHPGFGI